jgi:hypothetical protein
MKTLFPMLCAAVVGFLVALSPGCGAQQACSASNCAVGCCDAQGVCRPGDTAAVCGAGGHACVACQASACTLGVCRVAGDAGTGGGAATGGGTATGGGSSTGGGTATSPIVINELAASDGDFVELFNPTANSVDISGFTVADRDTTNGGPKLAEGLVLPAGTLMAAGAHLLFLSGTVAGPLTSCGAGVSSCFGVLFGLSATNGDGVYLLNAAGAVVAQVEYPANGHGAGHSWGRLPNGIGAFQETARTPGLPNQALPAATDAGAVDAGQPDAGAAAFVVVRVGPAADGGALSNASAVVALERRDLASGAVLSTVTLPTAGGAGAQHAFTLSGSASSEGLLGVAQGGALLTLVGYAIEPGVASVSSSASVGRVVARVSGAGAVDTATLVTDAYAANNVRAAATVDGTGYWLAGTSATAAGVRYVVQGSTGTSTDVESSITNVRSVKVVAGQLYASTQQADAGVRVFAVGTGTPTSITTTLTGLGTGASSAHDFALLDLDPGVAGPDTLYVADTAAGVGVRKYVLGTAWTEVAQLHVPATTSCFGVSVASVGGHPVVLCTTGAAVYRWDDTGVLQADGGLAEGQLLVGAPTGTAFRGVGLVP